VAGDRGFYQQANERWLKDSGKKAGQFPARGRESKEIPQMSATVLVQTVIKIQSR